MICNRTKKIRKGLPVAGRCWSCTCRRRSELLPEKAEAPATCSPLWSFYRPQIIVLFSSSKLLLMMMKWFFLLLFEKDGFNSMFHFDFQRLSVGRFAEIWILSCLAGSLGQGHGYFGHRILSRAAGWACDPLCKMFWLTRCRLTYQECSNKLDESKLD